MVRALFLVLICLAGLDPSATAENSGINIYCVYGSDCGGFYEPYRLNIFDDRIFNLAPPSAPSARAAGDDLDYDSAQRKAWIESCRPRLSTSFAAFQACFRDQQIRNAQLVRRQRESVQNRTEHLSR